MEIKKTPLIKYNGKTNWSSIFLKDESKQLTNAFKIRGVLNKFNTIDLNRYHTIITASTGNHGQAVALCAKKFEKKCIIVIPENTPKCKYDKISKYSPIIINNNLNSYDECKKLAINLAQQNGYLYIPSFDDYEIINGHKSLYEEIDWSEIEYCFCPIGGGGLVSAGLEYLKDKNVKIIGVEMENMDAMNQSLQYSKRLRIDISLKDKSIADGIIVSEIGEKNFNIAKNNNLEVNTVEEIEVKEAIKKLYLYNNIKAEGAGASTLACALKHQFYGKKCVCIISGGNIDDDIFNKIIGE